MTNPLIVRKQRLREKNGLGEGLTRTSDEDIDESASELTFSGEQPPELIRTVKHAHPRTIEAEPVREEYFEEEPDDTAINLIGDAPVSDASAAIKALLGEGGDIRAASQLEDDQVVAILDLYYVARVLNSPELVEIANDFLMLRISALGGTGRNQVVASIKGLYEPNNAPDNGGAPSGVLRGR